MNVNSFDDTTGTTVGQGFISCKKSETMPIPNSKWQNFAKAEYWHLF